MISSHRTIYLAIVVSIGLFGLSPIDALSPTTKADSRLSMGVRSSLSLESRSLPTLELFQLRPSISFALKSSQDDDNNEAITAASLSIDAVLGITASLVVLYSEYTLKTTGCGLPAGPFGIVGAIEGLSYLGVVGICANAVSNYFSGEGDNGSDNGARRLATTLGISAALAGVLVLGFQVMDYGYIPNAVPMEGGMCK